MTNVHEFDCVDCGIHVVSFAHEREPTDARVCLTCRWIRNIADPIEREKLREFLNRGESNGNR